MTDLRPLLAAALLWLAATGVSAAQETTPASSGSYTVQPGDILIVSVWKEEDLQQELMVRPDGYFSFPLAGDVRAETQTVEQIRQAVAERVGKYVPDPVVSIAVKEPRGARVYVLGQVNRPGEFPINRFVDVVQALSMAGGTTPFAQLDNIKVLRRQGNTQQAIPFAYGDVAAGRKLQQNIVLQPGDTVLVP